MNSQNGSQTSGVLAEGLGKRYGELWALRDFDLSVPAGSVLGLLGHNGAGKTTAIRILTTLALPSTGRHGWQASTSSPNPHECARASGSPRQAATVDGLLSRPREPRADRPALPSPTRCRPTASRRAARASLPDRRRRPPRAHLLRRHAQTARPRREPRRRTSGPVPRRADDRPRSAQPQRAVGAVARACARRRHAGADDPVPRGGRPAGR